MDHWTCSSHTTQPLCRRNLVSFLPSFPFPPSLPPSLLLYLLFSRGFFPIFQFRIFHFAAAGGARTCLFEYSMTV
ncbi:unnamed protein product [Tuber melanosporum]|uniref:(Perigord truffle) hypothetical protein n=1 Tax=Tuber melanosporum (strain Mel28) TaxID=656061 RepID=D5GQ30_TUBMM|nr:uncharacterized protein GSTUM_00012176001 [Tuber melanosporum]CAZ86623.1 unnamed protein product [Tuber melanosporum]